MRRKARAGPNATASWAGLLAILTSCWANAAVDVSVTTTRSGSAVAVEARATLSAPRELIWSTLTDYDHMSEFIPGMHASKVIARRANAAIVEQHGEAGRLFFSYGIDVVVRSGEHPPDLITIRVLSGNLRRLDGAYKLEAGDAKGTWVLSWSGLIEPSAPIPAFLAAPLMRGNVEAQFVGMLEEIERRRDMTELARAGSSLLRLVSRPGQRP
jgi:ribosome-associated toxin RatA of RatAB toxin-antitoxin module